MVSTVAQHTLHLFRRSFVAVNSRVFRGGNHEQRCNLSQLPMWGGSTTVPLVHSRSTATRTPLLRQQFRSVKFFPKIKGLFPKISASTAVDGEEIFENEEMELLRQEYQLAFVYCDAKDGIQHDKVLVEELAIVLKEFKLATDDDELYKFLRAASEPPTPIIDPNIGILQTTSQQTSIKETEVTSDSPAQPLHNTVVDQDSTLVEPDSTVVLGDDTKMVPFTTYSKMLTQKAIRSLRPVSLKLEHGDAFDERLRGKKFNEIPLKGHALIFYRRFANEAMHYGRGLKLFWQHFQEALKVVSKDVSKILWAGKENKVSASERRLLMTAVLDLAKLIPAIGLSCLPGGTFVLMLQSRLLPRTLPSTFQNAPRWEQVHLIRALQRDILRKFTTDKSQEKDVSLRWCKFLQLSYASREKSRLQPSMCFGLDLREAMYDEIDRLQPRVVYERVTPQHLDVVCDSMNIGRFRVAPLLHKRTPKLAHWIELMTNTFYDHFPMLSQRSKLQRFTHRVSTLRFNDRHLAERPGSILSLPMEELLTQCNERGIQVKRDGTSYRIITCPDTQHNINEREAEKLMRTWLTQWVALSTMHGFDPAFLALWSLELELCPEPCSAEKTQE
eukprot:m.109880 g.109880  ORF g.109880 m.109880 type:complete len:614 (-) comp27995_c0_seq1:56-1897(-)